MFFSASRLIKCLKTYPLCDSLVRAFCYRGQSHFNYCHVGQVFLLSCLVVILLMKEGTEKPVSDPSSVLCKQPKSCRKLLAERGLKTKSEVDLATHIPFSLNSIGGN